MDRALNPVQNYLSLFSSSEARTVGCVNSVLQKPREEVPDLFADGAPRTWSSSALHCVSAWLEPTAVGAGLVQCEALYVCQGKTASRSSIKNSKAEAAWTISYV